MENELTPSRRSRRRPRRRGRRAAGVILVIVGLVAAAGVAAAVVIPMVTGTSTPTSTEPLAASTSPTPVPSATAFVGVQGDIPSSATINGDPALRNDVALTACVQIPAGWQASGTAGNPTASARTLTIVVIFTDAEARAITSARIAVPVAPGATEQWSASADFTAPPGTKCVLAGVDSKG